MIHRTPFIFALLLLPACSKSSSETSKASTTPSATASMAAAKVDEPAAAPSTAGDAPLTGLTPAKLQENAGRLMSKKVSGEGFFYAYEAAKLNGEQTYSAYIADDDKKTHSFKCSLSGDPKIPPKTTVTFQGTWNGGGWMRDCSISKK